MMSTDDYNHDQPHLVTHPSAFANDDTHRRHTITAFLCVYVISRQYGGPQEGGWWYDAYEFTGAAFPFRAEQEYEVRELDEDQELLASRGELNVMHWQNDEGDYKPDDSGKLRWVRGERYGKWFGWFPVGLPHVTDEATRVRLESARQHFIDIYGDPDAKSRRGSVLSGSRGVDVAFIYELQPGARGEEPRPRYC